MKNEKHPDLILADAEALRQMTSKTRRALLVGGTATLAGIGFWKWSTRESEDDTLPPVQRRVLDFNGKLAQAYLSDHGLMPTYSRDRIGGIKPNGDIGMARQVSLDAWRVKVEIGDGNGVAEYSLADIKAMPKTELITRFCCIEGWSGVAQWGGVRFADIAAKVFPPGKSMPPYVYMATPNEEYFVGLDTKSALHPQTVLAYEQNFKPLEVNRGAPLRLAIPVKYGIKNIKQVSLIRFTNERAADYWADEQGYDWFAGL